jgi:lipopolysaccharide biosynthesis protein
MKRFCFALVEGTALLLHELIKFGVKPVKPLNNSVHVVVHVHFGHKLLGVFFPSLAEQNGQALDFVMGDFHPKQK